jgi:hypothetical protein
LERGVRAMRSIEGIISDVVTRPRCAHIVKCLEEPIDITKSRAHGNNHSRSIRSHEGPRRERVDEYDLGFAKK